MPPSKQRRASTAPAKRSKAAATIDYAALARFRYQLRSFLGFSEEAAQAAGLTPQQHQALLAIKGFSGTEPTTVGDIARYLLIRHHTAVELVNRMTKLGLLMRAVDAADGRRVLVTLTAQGERKLQALSKIHLEELTTAGPALGKILRHFRQSQKK
ncbi:helix-turn-helix domain-containing protein [Bradyrhizobium sp. CER78]|uniref:MarR family winged helix-turn-helix transcriptional regulator n=1 Tax=Bradyrhizobium sp. CER78 TaxID=3039162 RepID=UPI00244C1476|nr:helix-turn-helix domain-containing protein [Bradyrhizobium sp. CER78]MDH2386876.1 helix-turn-helix domain-containing protein [Bradyrhizobium sp. CER78]